MSNLTFTLGGVVLPVPDVPFIQRPLEMAVDVRTMDMTDYTDFTAHKQEWEATWFQLSKAEYETVRQIYRDQFNTGVYPTFKVPYLGIDTPVRVYFNDVDVQMDGCAWRSLKIRLTQRGAS